MGLLDLLLGKDNQFSQFADQNSNTLGAIGAGIAQGPTFSQGLANAAQGVGQAKALDKQTAIALQSKNATVSYLTQKYPDLGDYVKNGGSVQDAWTEAMRRDTEAQKQTVVGAGDTLYQNGKAVFTAPFKPNNPTNLRAGLGQPVPFKDKRTGEIIAAMPMTDGSYVDGRTGKTLDENFSYDPTGQAFDRASGSAQGKVAGGTQATLPIAAQTAQNALDTIAKLRNNTAGQDATFGTYGIGPLQIPDRYGPTFAQTPKADFNAVLQQAGGQAFLQAYSTLRGAGAISDTEGQKAGAAISRMMDPNISKEGFNAALDDYEAVIRAGYSRLQQQASQTGADPSTMPQLNAPAGPQTYTYNPATGELE